MTVEDTSNRAVIYTRISRDGDGDEEGVQRQEAACRELADRLGLTVSFVYSDNDIGASDRTHKDKIRVDFNELLLDAKTGAFKHVLAYSNSRLTRRLSELPSLVELVKDFGIKIHTVVSGDYDLSSADGLLIAQILTSVDAAESNRISERQKASFRDRASRGLPKLQRQRAFGWQQDGVTIEPEEAALIREGVQEVIAGASVTMVATKWEQAGILTAAGGTKWEWTVMHRVLVGWRTAGVRTYQRKPLKNADGSWVMGTWEPIISLEEREKAVAMLQNRGLKKERQGVWLLSGLLLCGVCGKPCYGQLKANRNHDTYACKAGHVAVNARRLETYIMSSIWAHLLNREAYEPDAPKTALATEVFPKEERMLAVASKSVELMDAYNAGVLDGSIAFPQVQKLHHELDELKREKARFLAERAVPVPTINTTGTVADFAKSIEHITAEADGGTVGERQLVYKRELEAIIVKRGVRGKSVRSYDDQIWMKDLEDRIDLMWRRPLTYVGPEQPKEEAL